MIENLTKFATSTKFQRCILAIMVGLADDKGNLSKLKLAFRQLDKNQDGRITKDDMEKAKVIKTFGMQQKWEELFKNVDLDNNGSVDYEEWITAAIDKQ